MLTQDLTFSKSLNPFSLPSPKWKFPHFKKSLNPVSIPKSPVCCFLKPLVLQNPKPPSIGHQHSASPRLLPHPPAAGRSKKTPNTGRIEGSAEVRREAKRNARRKSRKLAESLFYRLKNPNKSHPDNFSEEELQMIGLGYDRMVRFMSKDDPNLKHPYDWYKYGEFGPYSWRGVVVGDPIRGRMSDECATIIGTVRNHEEWEKIEQHEMAEAFGNRLRTFDMNLGLQNFWVFVRHPRWRLSDLPWEQWTLVCEVVLEAGDQRLDKWNLMGRLGNQTRAMITQCAAWMRPDIIYVKRPVFQCRFEPQVNFFTAMLPFLNPETENDFLFELEDDEGRVELITYFGGLCKIVKASTKAYVDDVVKAYEKLSDEKKSKCLEFLLMNHPVQLLHPYTKEWKAKLEEEEMGCDAPDDDDEDGSFHRRNANLEFTEWVEDDKDGNIDDDDDGSEDDYDVVVNTDEEDEEEDELGLQEDDLGDEEDEKYWKDEFQKAMRSNNEMETFVKRSVERTSKLYEKQLKEMEESESTSNKDEDEDEDGDGDGDETALRGKRAKVSPQEWKTIGMGPWRKKTKKSKIPPELFLRAAIRPFTYRNLVKEIVLTRHAILDGDIELDK
ncbi:hypothetical protein SOVF_153780 [Spinacia oleracea]|uniref:Uncharacterized protein n=1 Tax=Spinacia oleracea TaxID=3562 RepID=A0A9R0J6V1_SPIOL|nr:uncharacterized protein LOC110801271 [Spinacia oleracea]KNA09414.1 hypothetical protein SOVF_153780 [Spinacia oleracea]